jgi:hypothetical protein
MARTFNGTNQYIGNLSAAPISALPFTLCCWFRPNSLTGQCISLTGSSGGQVLLGISGSGQAVLSMRDNAFTTGTATTATTAATTGNWHFLAAVCASSSSRFSYLNGIASATNTTALGTINSFSRFGIGVRATASPDSFVNGSIAEVAVWNSALSVDELNGLAKAFNPRLISTQNQRLVARLIFDISDIKNGLTLNNVNGTTAATHPRIIYP